MSDSIYRGVLEFEATDKNVSSTMADIAGSAGKMEKATEKAAKNAGDAMKQQADITEREARRIAAQARRLETSIIRQGEQAGIPRSQYLSNRAQALGILDRPGIQASLDKIRQSEQVVTKLGMSAKQTAQAMRLLPAQFTDIFTSIASGMPLYLVAIQQGGQIKDSFGGIGAAMKAVMSVITPLRIAMGASAAAVVGLALAYRAGAAETDAFNRALILNGSAADVSAEQLYAMAANIDNVVGTHANAAKVLTALAGTGRVVGSDLERVGEAIVRVNQLAGIAVGDLVKEYAELGRDPLEASIKLNEQYRHLTLSAYEAIKAFDDVGNRAEAASLAQLTLADKTIERMAQLEASLSPLASMWMRIKKSAGEAWDAMLGIGRDDASALKAAEDTLAAMKSPLKTGRFAASPEAIRLQEARVAALRAIVEEKEKNKVQQAGLEATRENAKWTEAALKANEKITRELEKYRANVVLINAARAAEGLKPLSAEQIKREEAEIRKQYADKTKSAGDDAATKMIADAKEANRVLREEMALQDNVNASTKKLLEFEEQILEIRRKKASGEPLTQAQKEIDARWEEVWALLEGNKELHDRVEIEKEMLKLIEKQNAAHEASKERFDARAEAIKESIEAAREGRLDAYDRELSGLGMGDFARQQTRDAEEIYREFRRYQQQLSRSAAKEGYLGSDRYIQEMTKIKDALDQSLKDHEDYYARLRKANEDWTLGVSQASNTYLEDLDDRAGRTREIWEGTFKSMEDAVVEFSMSGTNTLRGFFDFIRAELTRNFLRDQLIGPLAQVLGNIRFGPAAPITASRATTVLQNANGAIFGRAERFADGDIFGSPTAFRYGKGKVGVMGEAGYEAVMPVVRGPDGKLGVKSSGGDFVFSPTFEVHGEMTRSQETRLVLMSKNAAMAAYSDARRRGVVE